jgi:superfamily II DNA or RNA helicase
MKTRFKEIDFPDSFEYRSDSEHIPLEFYNEVFPISKKVDLFLGYFNSGAFRVLSESFAEFIYNGGSMRMITNHCYTKLDFDNLIAEPELNDYGEVSKLIKDLRQLKNSLDDYGQLFFDCLKYLIKEKRLEIQPVSFGKQSLSHSKKMLIYDGEDYILTQGSMNFTLAGIVKNSESFQVEVPWNSHVSKVRIKEHREHFESVFNKQNPHYTYLDKNEIEQVIDEIGNEKSITSLLQTTINLGNENYNKKLKEIHKAKKEKFENIIEKIENEPHFPFDEPRDYQKQAYENWVENDYKGVFAMATGTGKTITSLNCVLQEYQKNKTYRFIVLVPTISLAEQWHNEITNKFNYQNCLVCSSNSNWESVLQQYGKEITFGIENNFSVIATYATFRGLKFQNIINQYFEGNLNKLILIADEAHTLGSAKLLEVLPTKIDKRIGLSATPERVYDKYGQSKLSEFFNSYPPEYTFNYNMQKAIREGVLCKYYYYPRFVELQEEELIDYKVITKKLYKYIDSKSGRYKDLPEVTNLLIKRKSIIHKAHSKLDCLNDITNEIGIQNFKYTFIYVPEGFEVEHSENDNNILDGESLKLIDKYAELLNNQYDLKLRKYLGGTKDREQILMQFQEGKLNTLLAMKCLDEGVDVPRAQYAIFCSSTGNPRQYVQRRGRILRTHEDKDYAYIYDMVVKPPEEITNTNSKAKNAEKSIFEGELRRLVNFTSLAENKIEILEEINYLAKSYDIDIYEMLNKELEKYNDENT